MSKLDWSRASERAFDPARYQQRADFLTPDEVKKAKPKKRKPAKPPTPAQLRKQAAHKARIKAIQDEKERKKEAERKAKAEARRATFEEYMKTPEYAAKQAREAARPTAIKKSHLQVWVEEETGLCSDRESLRSQWREKLLRRPYR